MNDEKFASVGEKLQVERGELPNNHSNQPSMWLKKAGFFLVQALVLAVSAILGLLLGFTEHSYYSYYPLMYPPECTGGKYGVKIDFSRLSLQFFVVVVITGGLIYTFRDKKGKND